MVHGYHVILVNYGFWLPNDPQGSWSDAIWKWELARFGPPTKSLQRRSLDQLSAQELLERDAAKRQLRYPAVTLSGVQARAVAAGFSKQVQKSGYTVWACSILPEHTHIVLARHTYKVEQMTNLLKGASSAELVRRGLHPLAAYSERGERPPRIWAAHAWKVYLDSEQAIVNAIRYVEENPVKEGKPRQRWSFVTPFAGIERGGWQTYH